jgi:predicted DNA-binding antitoxin AbrB/MazE fold protein
MMQQVEAVYENGVLRPLAPVELTESQRVTLTIICVEAGDELLDVQLLERARAEVATMKDAPTIEEVRAQLATINGSVAETVIAERGEY